MNTKTLAILMALAGLVLASAAPGLRAETVDLESGNSSQFSLGQQDTSITMLQGPLATYPDGPLVATAFTSANFSAAQSGPNPYVVSSPQGGGVWMQNAGFTPDPLSQWISFNAAANTNNYAEDMLFAQQFNIATAGITSATLNFSWAVDDSLGDPSWAPGSQPNPLGVYINGYAVPGISGGSAFTPTSVLNINIPASELNTGGNNYLYVYNRDTAGDYSGAIYSAELTVTGEGGGTSGGTVPEPLTMIALGMGIAGLGGYIRRRRLATK
jgi:hypothetical protein